MEERPSENKQPAVDNSAQPSLAGDFNWRGVANVQCLKIIVME